MVLNLWVETCLGTKQPFHRELYYQILTIPNSNKFSYEAATKAILWLGPPQHKVLYERATKHYHAVKETPTYLCLLQYNSEDAESIKCTQKQMDFSNRHTVEYYSTIKALLSSGNMDRSEKHPVKGREISSEHQDKYYCSYTWGR